MLVYEIVLNYKELFKNKKIAFKNKIFIIS